MRHLKRRHQTWYARVRVPAHLQATIGKPEIVRTLATHDLKEAKRRLRAALAVIQGELAAAERDPAATHEVSPLAPEWLLRVARSGLTDVAMEAATDAHLERLRDVHGSDEEGDPNIPEQHAAAIRLAHRVHSGAAVALFSSSVASYLTEVKKAVRPQTLETKRKTLDAFKAWMESDFDMTAVTRKVAGKYLTESIVPLGRQAKTDKTTLSHLSAFWAWCCKRGTLDDNLWRGLGASLQIDRRGKEAPRRPWTEDELHKLVTDTPTDDPLWSLAVLGMYSGARIEELCALKVADVAHGALRIREGKSDAAVREVPVHPVIAPLITRLSNQSSDGWLIPGLLASGRDQRRSAGASKRFGYHTRHHLKIIDPGVVFHSLRNTLINHGEAAGIHVTTMALIVGHRQGRDGLTYGQTGSSYSSGLPLPVKAKELAKVSYGRKLDSSVRALTDDVKITKWSRRRTKRSTSGA